MLLKAIITNCPEKISDFTAVFVTVISGSAENGRMKTLKLFETDIDEKSLKAFKSTATGDIVNLDIKDKNIIVGFYNISRNLGRTEIYNLL